MFGRLLQGISGGLIGVVVPLYLAECLGAANRGKGTGIFQWLLTFGIMAAAVIGMIFSIRVDHVTKLGDAAQLLAFKDHAWRSIFWVSLPPGILFVLGRLLHGRGVSRWLFRQGRLDAARAALARSRAAEQVEVEMAEMQQTAADELAQRSAGGKSGRESLLRRKYLVPFFLACVILACNQATGVNSIIGYNTTILFQAGLSDLQAQYWGYVLFTAVNFIATLGAVALVDRKGRKFLLSLGTAGIIVSLLAIGLVFRRTENLRVDCRDAVQALVTPDQKASVPLSTAALLAGSGPAGQQIAGRPATLTIIYSYGDFRGRHGDGPVRRSRPAGPIEISRDGCLPAQTRCWPSSRIRSPTWSRRGPRRCGSKTRVVTAGPVASGTDGSRPSWSTASWLSLPWGPACAFGWPCRS